MCSSIKRTPSESSATKFVASSNPKNPPPTRFSYLQYGNKVNSHLQESSLKKLQDRNFEFPPKPSSLSVFNHGGSFRLSKSDFDSFPVGFRFCPTDVELLVCYLRDKLMNKPLPPNRFLEINLSHYNPEGIAELYDGTGLKEFYFFTPRDKKYRNGNRPKRSAGDGYWKATGSGQKILSNGIEVGSKKSLVFYEGKPPKGRKTNWIMHEFKVNDPPPCKNEERLDDWVLCRIYKKHVKSPEEKDNSTAVQHVVDSTLSDNTMNDCMHQILQSPIFEHFQPTDIRTSINEEYEALTSDFWTSMEPFCTSGWDDRMWNFTSQNQFTDLENINVLDDLDDDLLVDP